MSKPKPTAEAVFNPNADCREIDRVRATNAELLTRLNEANAEITDLKAAPAFATLKAEHRVSLADVLAAIPPGGAMVFEAPDKGV